MDSFLRFINQFVSLSDANRVLLASKLKTRRYTKGNLLLLQGDICDKIIFITSGHARSYYTDFAGKTFTWYFHFNDQNSKFSNFFAIDYQSFLTQSASRLHIEALTDIEATVIDYQDSAALQPLHIDFEKLNKLVTEQAYITTHNRSLSLLTLSATQRYEQLLADEPYLLNKFANHYIGSYLGITPQSLSRIRGDQ